MRRGPIVALLGIGALAAAIATAVALLFPWLPHPASDERDRIDFVTWFTVAICIAIFAVVAAVMIYAVIRFRAAPDDDSDGSPVHGNTQLEIIWTLVPTVLVTAIAIVSAVVLARNDALAKDTLTIDVTAQQFAWSFTYPEAKNLTTGTLRVPLGRSVDLHFTSKDVIHSFWVQEFGQKQDTVPGIQTHLHITPNKVGTYPVICTELCGLGHAVMRTEVVVMPAAAFDKWLKGQTSQTSSSSTGTSGLAVFTNNQCSGCHTLRAANAQGKIGPDLDKLPQYAQQAGQSDLAGFIRQSIVQPNDYVQPGFPKNVMPPFDLPKPQLDALVQYLIQSSKKG
ncbi:MAG TPA: cytochrome c oxidase subunit II [Gaiellaceae bacterium]|nr:cytochrome c oxidase subunit II [Gaiellaceae bacterium]